VNSTARGQFCTPELQNTFEDNELVFERESIYKLYIYMKNKVGREDAEKGRSTSQDA